MVRAFGLLVAILALAGTATAEEAARVGDPYTLDTCAVAGEELGSMGEPIVHVKDGREVRFCCAGCIKRYDADPAKYNAKVDEKLIAGQEKNYPLSTCINSGEDLGTGAKSFIVGNRLMKTCCGDCEKAVKAEPAKFLAKLDAAVKEKQGPTYAAKTCPISGKPIEGSGVEIVLANHLVRLCCEACKGGVEKEPAAVLSKLDGKAE